MAQSIVHEALTNIYASLAKHPNGVVRDRIWSASALLEGLLMLVAGRSSRSTAGVLRAWAARGVDVDDWDEIPSRSGFCQARDRLPASTLRLIWQDTVRAVRALVPASGLVFGLRPVAIDGTHVLTPREQSTKKRFGLPRGGTIGGVHHYPQALLVFACEIFTRLPLAAELLPWNGSERAGLRALLPALGTGTLAIMDRGYVGKRMLAEVIASGAQVVLRMTASETNSWDCVYHFLKGKSKETIVELPLPFPDGSTKTVPVRLIRRAFRRGRPRAGQKPQTMVILTTLTDQALAPREEIIDLYAERWSIETRFRELKTTLNLEAFHSRKVHGVEQEIMAAMIWMTLAACVELQADRAMAKQRGPQRWNDPHRWQINRALLCELLDALAVDLLTHGIEHEAIRAQVEHAATYLARCAQRKRPGRTNPRKRAAPHGRFRNGGLK